MDSQASGNDMTHALRAAPPTLAECLNIYAPSNAGAEPLHLSDIALPLCLIDSDRKILWANAAFEALAKAANLPGSLGERLDTMIATSDRARLASPLPSPIDLRFSHAGGTGRWHELRVLNPAPATRGGKSPALLLVTDVDEQHAHSELETAFRAETGHRFRNLLTVVAALVHDTLGQTPDATAVARLLDRLRSLQSAGYVGDEVLEDECSIQSLVRRILGRFHDPDDDRISLFGEDLRLSRQWGNALALILHELATNCVKHGAWTARTGKVSVRWCPITVGDDSFLHVEWRETGGPPVYEPHVRGYGLSFIDRVLGRTKGAAASFRFASTGLVCQLDLPVDRPGSRS